MLTLAEVAASGPRQGRTMQRGGYGLPDCLFPRFNINPDAFRSAWNDDVDCRDTALAERLDHPPAGYPIDPGTALIFLGGVATTIATSVVTDLISKLLEQKFFNKEQKPALEIVVMQQAPGTQLLVVKGHERCA